MSNRTWFYATADKQQVSCPEDQLRGLIGAGTVTPDTLVWREGMANWQPVREVLELRSSPLAPPAFQRPATTLATADAGGAPLRADFSIWVLLVRSLVYLIGILLVIPAPWVATGFYRWLIPQLQVPQRPNLAFTGKPADIWYVHILLASMVYAGLFISSDYLVYVLAPVQAFLAWMVIRWAVANISSNGQRLPLAFTGESWMYVGWFLLLYISFITVVGWAWVMTAWIRWICSNIAGTRRAVLFNASGWELLWRSLVFALASGLLLPLPWALGWYARWYVSQFALAERSVLPRTAV